MQAQGPLRVEVRAARCCGPTTQVIGREIGSPKCPWLRDTFKRLVFRGPQSVQGQRVAVSNLSVANGLTGALDGDLRELRQGLGRDPTTRPFTFSLKQGIFGRS
jgi:hypothetical protein